MKLSSFFSYGITLLLAAALTNVSAQQTVTIPIETASNALVLKTDARNNLNIIYFGKKLSRPADYDLVPQSYRQTGDYTEVLSSAYTASGSKNLVEPAITVTHADGDNSLDLRFVNHTVAAVDANV